jgi:hypothetical protein
MATSKVKCTPCQDRKKRTCFVSGADGDYCDYCAWNELECDYREKNVKDLLDLAHHRRSAPPQPFQDISNIPLEFRQVLTSSNVGIVLSIDLGTSHTGASWEVLNFDQPHPDLNAREVQFDGSARPRTQVAFITEESGSRVPCITESVLTQHEVDFAKRFKYIKLYGVSAAEAKDLGHQGFVQKAQRAAESLLKELKAKSALPAEVSETSDIVVGFLRALRTQISTTLQTETGMTSQQVDWVIENKVRLIVAAPAKWTSRLSMQLQAYFEKAGFPCPDIRSEPKLALAMIVHQSRAAVTRGTLDAFNSSQLLNRVTTVVDIGGGTVDVAQLQVTQIHPEIRYETKPLAHGAVAGSETVNDAFTDHLRDTLKSDLAHLAHNAGCTEDGFLELFADSFEKAKRHFAMEDPRPTIKISTKAGTPTITTSALVPEFKGSYFELSTDVMRSILDDQLAAIYQVVDMQLKNPPKTKKRSSAEKPVIHLIGGGARLPYVRDKFQAHYKMRYNVICKSETE